VSEPIKVGDLVMVVRKAGYCECFLGLMFKVTAIGPSPDGTIDCGKCGDVKPTTMDARRANGGWQPLVRLVRIPPLEELDDVKEREELHA
jgi:hypothetical protein